MDLRDARRLASTCLLLTGVLVLWLILLALDDADLFNWSWPTSALKSLALSTWMWIGTGTLAVLGASLVGIVFAMGLGARAPTRQVQCGECRAVFFIPDNGRRPLTHTCPNCKSFGIYQSDEKAEAAPRPAASVVVSPPAAKAPNRDFTCPKCASNFQVVDIGLRPLRITCPKCSTSGVIR